MEYYSSYTKILHDELKGALGCTEPIAIAYAAALLKDALGCTPCEIKIELSGNIIKNVKSVIVPATMGMHGIKSAVCAGIVSGAYERELEVLTALTPTDAEKIRELSDKISLEISELQTDKPFEIKIQGKAGELCAFVHLADRHTNVVNVTRGTASLTEKYKKESFEALKEAEGRELLTVEGIVDYASNVSLDEIKPILLRQIDMNMAIAYEGVRGDYGASIGKLLYNGGDCSLKDKARALAAAGSDARMSGCEMPVCIISGSGNQGMCSSIPVIVYARDMGVSEETLLRALLITNLITIHQKTGIGCLSAYCGAISAGCGAGCGIAYLNGGGYYEIAHTLVNSLAILSGTICDGAKPSCAAKIAMAVEAGIMGYEMMRAGKQFYGGDGIVTKGVENTIKNVGRLARRGMEETDREIIKIMLG